MRACLGFFVVFFFRPHVCFVLASQMRQMVVMLRPLGMPEVVCLVREPSGMLDHAALVESLCVKAVLLFPRYNAIESKEKYFILCSVYLNPQSKSL